MSKKDYAADAHKVLGQINENLSRIDEPLRFVGVNFVKRGDFTLAVIHAQTLDPVTPISVIGYGFSKLHPEDESERKVGYEFALKRAIDDTFHEYTKAVNAQQWR